MSSQHKPLLHIIIGSTRPGRKGPLAAHWFADFAREHGTFDVELVDLADFKLPLLDEYPHPSLMEYENEPTLRWSASVNRADAFVFVTPEYDHFAPASLVNAVQCLLKEWNYKAAGLVCYGGASGGMRASAVLKQLLCNVGVMPVSPTVPIHNYAKAIAGGAFAPHPTLENTSSAMLNELHTWTRALAVLRPH